MAVQKIDFIRNSLLLSLLMIESILGQPEARCSVHNLLSNPVYIGSKPGSLSPIKSTIDSTPEFTLTFWLRFNEIPERKIINVLSLYNLAPAQNNLEARAKNSLNPNFPNCPVSPNYLKKNPYYLDDPYIKNNPNCFPEAPQPSSEKNVNPMDYIQRLLEISLYKEKGAVLTFDMPASYNATSSIVSYVTQSLPDFEIQHNDWVFMAVSLDYAKGKGLAYISDLRSQENEFKVDFKLELPELQLKRDYLVRYSENASDKNAVYGYLYDMNIFYMFMESLDLLRFANYDDMTLKMQNIRLNLLFDAKNTTQPLVSKVDMSSNFEVHGHYTVEPLGYRFKSGATLPIGSIENYPLVKLVQSATFYMTVKLEKDVVDGFVLLNAHRVNSTDGFEVRFVRDDIGASVFYALEARVNNSTISYKTPRFITTSEYSSFTFSVIQTAAENINFYFSNGRKLFDASPMFKNTTLPLSALNYTFFNDTNKGEVEVSRLIMLDSPLPSILSVQKNTILSSCNKECEIPLDPHMSPRACLQCTDSVLFPTDNKCLEFCPPGYKNSNGVCKKCLDSKCQEINPATMVISRLNNTAFLLQLTKKVAQLDSTNLDKIFTVDVEGLERGKDFGYELQIGSSKTVLLNMDIRKGVYNATMNVRTNFTEFGVLYDENRDFIYSLDGNYTIPSVHFLDDKSKFWSDFLAYILFAIFLLILAIGAAMFLLSFKYNMNEYVVKKLAVLFRSLQLIPMLLFLHVAFPSNLHNFLSTLYTHIIGFNAAITPFVQDMYLITSETPHPNFFDKQLTTLFLQNFGIVFIIHCTLLLCYIALLILNCFYKFVSMGMKEFILKARDIFEYNLLIVALVLFDYQIFVFANLNFAAPKLHNNFTQFSLAVAVIYLCLFGVMMFTYLGFYFKANKFVPQSDRKFKISFMFIGYRNRPIPNLYEVVVQLFHFGTAAILVYLKNYPLPQITGLIAWTLLYCCVTVLMQPFESSKEAGLELLNRMFFLCILILVGSIAVGDYNQSYDFDYRETVGWIVVGVISVYIIFNFVVISVQLLLFLWRIKSSSKLIFYDKEDGFSSIHMGRGSRMLAEAYKNDDEMEEKQMRGSSLGKLGDLGKHSGDSYFFTENNPKMSKENTELEHMKSGNGSGHDSYLSHSDETFNSQKHSICQEKKIR